MTVKPEIQVRLFSTYTLRCGRDAYATLTSGTYGKLIAESRSLFYIDFINYQNFTFLD